MDEAISRNVVDNALCADPKCEVPGQHAHVTSASDPVAQTADGSWGFWDETWTDFQDGFDTEEEARAALRRYVRSLEGPVRLIWATPDGDKQIAYLARVSNSKATPDDPADRLIGYLLRNHHWSPFEMANMCLEINTTRDITNQIIRHRSFSFQEFSTRYADVEELVYGKECRFQDDKNRQNSFTVDQMPDNDEFDTRAGYEQTLAYFDAVVNETRVRSMEAYEELRRRGVAKEVARCILPFGLLPSKIYMNGTVRSWLHYIAERTKPGVQKEHREIALAAESCLRDAFPMVYAAFQNEQLRGYAPVKE